MFVSPEIVPWQNVPSNNCLYTHVRMDLNVSNEIRSCGTQLPYATAQKINFYPFIRTMNNSLFTWRVKPKSFIVRTQATLAPSALVVQVICIYQIRRLYLFRTYKKIAGCKPRPWSSREQSTQSSLNSTYTVHWSWYRDKLSRTNLSQSKLQNGQYITFRLILEPKMSWTRLMFLADMIEWNGRRTLL